MNNAGASSPSPEIKDFDLPPPVREGEQKIRARGVRTAFWVSAVFLLTACTTATAEPRAKTLADASPEPSAEIPAPDARASDVLSLLAAIYTGWPEGDEGRQSMQIDIAKNDDGAYQATIIQAGLLDDLVAQTKDTLTFGYDGQWYVSGFEQHRKCYRTGMFEWTTKPCP